MTGTPIAGSTPGAARRIQIAFERHADIRPGFFIHLLVDAWREAGHAVDLVRYDAIDRAADAVVPHFDRTFVPDPFLERAPPGRTLNHRVRDISKSRISGQRVDRGDAWAGPVIVKTNRNSFAAPDHVRGLVPGFAMAGLRRLLPWRVGRLLPRRDYPVLAHLSEVPGWVWGNEEFVVERFLPECRGGRFVTRNWVFLGRREHNQATLGGAPLVKTGAAVTVERCDGPPAVVRDLRERLGIDYGKIDWASGADGPVVYDVNTTPTATARMARHRDIARHLAAGLF